jgi:hypothetical protein
MWLGGKSIRGLQMTLGGIEFAEDFHQVPTERRFGGFDFAAFETWVEQTHNPERLSLRSFGLSAHLAGSDAGGFDLWFRWYDAFLEERGGGAAAG